MEFVKYEAYFHTGDGNKYYETMGDKRNTITYDRFMAVGTMFKGDTYREESTYNYSTFSITKQQWLLMNN